jgi:hypothetical protein
MYAFLVVGKYMIRNNAQLPSVILHSSSTAQNWQVRHNQIYMKSGSDCLRGYNMTAHSYRHEKYNLEHFPYKNTTHIFRALDIAVH